MDTTPWPPPADPTPMVTTAVTEAEAAGVHHAVVIMDRTAGTILTQLNADQPFPALSLVKLMITADVLSGADPTAATNLDDAPAGSDKPAGPAKTGSADPAGADPAVRALVREMIVRSDDVTASNLYEQAGGDAMVDRITRRYALTGTTPTPDGVYWGNVQTTAADMASLLNHHDGSLSVGPGCVADEGFVAGAEFAAKNAELLHGSQGHPPPGFTLSRRIAVGWARNS